MDTKKQELLIPTLIILLAALGITNCTNILIQQNRVDRIEQQVLNR